MAQTEYEHLPERLLSYLTCNAMGREHAVKSSELESVLGCSDRHLRKAINKLEDLYNIAVLSSYNMDTGGYYLPRTRAEAREGLLEYRAHAFSELQRFNYKAALVEILFGETDLQLPLPFGDPSIEEENQ